MTGVKSLAQFILRNLLRHDRVQLDDTQLVSTDVLVGVEEGRLLLEHRLAGALVHGVANDHRFVHQAIDQETAHANPNDLCPVRSPLFRVLSELLCRDTTSVEVAVAVAREDTVGSLPRRRDGEMALLAHLCLVFDLDGLADGDERTGSLHALRSQPSTLQMHELEDSDQRELLGLDEREERPQFCAERRRRRPRLRLDQSWDLRLQARL